MPATSIMEAQSLPRVSVSWEVRSIMQALWAQVLQPLLATQTLQAIQASSSTSLLHHCLRPAAPLWESSMQAP